MTSQHKKSFIINVIYALIIVGIIYAVYKFLIIYLLPFLIGLTLAYFLQKPSAYIAYKTGLKKGTVCATLVIFSFCTVIFLLSGIVFLIISNTDTITAFISEVAVSLTEISVMLTDNFSVEDTAGELLSGFIQNIGNSIAEFATGTISSAAGSLMKKLPALLFSVIITVVASFYIAKDYKAVRDYIVSFIPENKKTIVFAVKRILTVNIFKMVKGYIILSLITFLELSVAFLIMGLDNAITTALIIALVDILPVLGTGIVLVPWSLISVLQGDVAFGAVLMIVYLAVMITRNFAEPKIVGRQVGIPPIVSLILLFLGLKLFGFIGMLFSILSLIVIINLYKEKIIDL